LHLAENKGNLVPEQCRAVLQTIRQRLREKVKKKKTNHGLLYDKNKHSKRLAIPFLLQPSSKKWLHQRK
jgi:hypothetical protein